MATTTQATINTADNVNKRSVSSCCQFCLRKLTEKVRLATEISYLTAGEKRINWMRWKIYVVGLWASRMKSANLINITGSSAGLRRVIAMVTVGLKVLTSTPYQSNNQWLICVGTVGNAAPTLILEWERSSHTL